MVEGDGTQVVGHVGLNALGSFANRLGVGDALSDAVGWQGPGCRATTGARCRCMPC